MKLTQDQKSITHQVANSQSAPETTVAEVSEVSKPSVKWLYKGGVQQL